MFIKFDIQKNQLVYNHEQLVQDADLARLKLDFGWRGVKFAIDYFWQGSPYSGNEENSRLKLAYDNAIEWFPDETRFGYKNEARFLRLDSKDCYANIEIFKKCGKKINQMFPMPELENFNALTSKEQEFQFSLSYIDIKSAVESDDDELIRKRTESARSIAQSMSAVTKLRQEAEIQLQERLSQVKIASLDTFLN